MKKYLLLLLVAICTFSVMAQNAELNKLIDIVKSLQTGGEQAYNGAVSTLADDKLWTPMDELGIDRNVECRASDRVPGFKLNSVLTNAENKERYQTSTGNHLNGADMRYNYSLFEKTLKSDKSASFALPGRWGEQILVIIPFDPLAKISAKAVSGSNDFTATQLGHGCLKLTGAAVKSHTLNLTITNNSASNVSYVIINYNSRK